MSISAAVDVLIGLMFCYLLLGLIASSLQEALAGWTNLRGVQLRRSLRKLLSHGKFGTHQSDWLFEKVYKHGLIAPPDRARAPSYVSAANFSMALVDGLLDSSQAPLFSQVEASVARLPDSPVKQSLAALLVHAQGDYEVFIASLQRWFDDAMDRVSGIYKRYSQNFLLIFGLAVAFGGNIDSIFIARTLWGDPVAREQLVDMAAEDMAARKPPAAAANAASASAPSDSAVAEAASSVRSSIAQFKSLPIPVGWSGHVPMSFVKFIGCLVTALAVSLGAPFWFDLLKKFLNVRAAGPKPARSDGTSPR